MVFDLLFSFSDLFLIFDFLCIIFIILRNSNSEEIEKKAFYSHLFLFASVTFIGLIYFQLCIPSVTVYYYNYLFISSEFIIFIRICIYSITLICITFVFVTNKNILSLPLSEFYILIYLFVLGIVLSISSNDLFCIFLFIELQSLILYIYIALSKNSNLAIEAAFRYFILGTFASSLLIFGISLVYYNYGICSLTSLSLVLTKSTISFSAKIGFISICCSLLLKLGMAPFHYWIADVHQGSHLVITAIFAILTKLPILLIFLKLYLLFVHSYIDLKFIIIIFSIISIFLGSFLAMYETTFQRFLAYSTISHMGFIVLGCVAATPDAYFASIYYMFSYILHNIILFSILLIFLDQKVAQPPIFLLNKLQTLVCVRQSNFLIAVLLSIVFLSMAGLPPFIGFFAKFFILKALMDNGYIGLCALGLIASLFSSIHYIRCVRFLLFMPDDRTNYLNIDYSNHFILVSISVFFSILAIMLILVQTPLIIYLQTIILTFFFF